MPKMMPGQEPYTDAELLAVYALVADAAKGDPGERAEPTSMAAMYEGWSNRATWHAALVIHNEYATYKATHDPARLARLRERPWSIQTWAETLEAAWAETVPADLRRATAEMPGRIDWWEIASDCAAEIMEG